MIINALRSVYQQNQDKHPLLLRNLLKEQLQYWVLNFIYNSDQTEKFLFKGETCLRFCFGLPRLSEDLDFDVEDFNQFSFEKFRDDLGFYFKTKLKYEDFEIKIAGKNEIIYLRFPILRKIGFPVEEKKPSEDILFLRIDLAPIRGQFFKKEISLKSTADFSFLIRRYSLADLFANKIAAILTRETLDGKKQQPRFKGRDYFDLFWFCQKGVKLNYHYLLSLTGLSSRKEVEQKIQEKLEEAKRRKKDLELDLLPFFENQNFVRDFVENLEKLEVEEGGVDGVVRGLARKGAPPKRRYS